MSAFLEFVVLFVFLGVIAGAFVGASTRLIMLFCDIVWVVVCVFVLVGCVVFVVFVFIIVCVVVLGCLGIGVLFCVQNNVVVL